MHRVESLGDVKFEEQNRHVHRGFSMGTLLFLWCFLTMFMTYMKLSCILRPQMKALWFIEIIECMSGYNLMANTLYKILTKAYWSIVSNFLRSIFIWNKDHICRVEKI